MVVHPKVVVVLLLLLPAETVIRGSRDFGTDGKLAEHLGRSEVVQQVACLQVVLIRNMMEVVVVLLVLAVRQQHWRKVVEVAVVRDLVRKQPTGIRTSEDPPGVPGARRSIPVEVDLLEVLH